MTEFGEQDRYSLEACMHGPKFLDNNSQLNSELDAACKLAILASDVETEHWRRQY
jgi:hypothetical protein